MAPREFVSTNERKHQMKIRVFAGLSCALIAFSLSESVIMATPSDQSINYSIYFDVNDLSQGVYYDYTIDLSPVAQDGNSIGWSIDQVTFHRHETETKGENVWYEEFPEVLSPDGLWWIDYVDPENPTIDEFLMPPAVTGDAQSIWMPNETIMYWLVGIYYYPCGPSPFPVTGAVKIRVREEGDPDQKPDLDDIPPPVRPVQV